MSAFNWILIDSACPICTTTSAIRCQTHIASDYGGDERGRFHDREYHLGEPMLWWPRHDARFPGWRVDGRKTGMASSLTTSIDEEACYSCCTNCGADLCVVLEFHENVPTKVLQITRQEDWPDEYFR